MEGILVEGILVVTAARPQGIHFDSFWALPGFQYNHEWQEKYANVRVVRENLVQPSPRTDG